MTAAFQMLEESVIDIPPFPAFPVAGLLAIVIIAVLVALDVLRA